VVLIAGKGHEEYQIAGGQARPFSDRQVVREAQAGAA
jgi:UDP-N-acetylmuramyl tripeptide synthase